MSGVKRKRPDPAGDADHLVLNAIKSRKNLGIWERELKTELKLGDNVVVKSIKSLLAKKLIKNFVNINNKGRKTYMAIEFEPSKELTGGDWYSDGKLDTELIGSIKKFCMMYMKNNMKKKVVTTVEGLHNELKMKNITKFEMSRDQTEEILNSMVLDNEVMEVKSTGLAEYYSIPVGTTCYRPGAGNTVTFGPFASLPCGACPRISLCSPDGAISPSTCVYFTKWLEF